MGLTVFSRRSASDSRNASHAFYMDHCGHTARANRTVPPSEQPPRLRCLDSNESMPSRPTGPECSGRLSRHYLPQNFAERLRGDFCEGHARAAVQAMRSKKSASGRTDTHRKHIPRVTGFRVQALARAGVPTNRSKNCAVRWSGVRSVPPGGNGFSVRLFGRLAAAVVGTRRSSRGLSAAYRRLTAGACLWPLCRSPTAVLGVRPPDNPARQLHSVTPWRGTRRLRGRRSPSVRVATEFRRFRAEPATLAGVSRMSTISRDSFF
jgi:hypothetical protein